MTTEWTDRLSEYLDGSLAPDERQACEAWLGSSAEGRALLEELRRVVAKAKTLPDVAVPGSVWSEIAAGIRQTPAGRSEDRSVVSIERARPAPIAARRWTLTPVQLAAAAIVVLALGVAAGLALRAKGNDAGIAQRPFPGRPGGIIAGVPLTTVSNPVAERANVSYDNAVQELQLLLDRNRSNLDTSTVRVLEQSLGKIDVALQEAQDALAHDPHNAYLNDHLTRIKRKKLDLLRQGASLVRAS